MYTRRRREKKKKMPQRQTKLASSHGNHRNTPFFYFSPHKKLYMDLFLFLRKKGGCDYDKKIRCNMREK